MCATDLVFDNPAKKMRVDAAQAAVEAAVPFYFQPTGDCPGDADTTDGLSLCALMPAVTESARALTVTTQVRR